MDIIKKQRVKFTVTMTVCAAIFLFALLGGFYGIAYASNEASISAALEKALASPDKYNDEAYNGLQCSFIIYDGEGHVIRTSNLNYGSDMNDQIIANAFEKKEGKFNVGKSFFICKGKGIKINPMTDGYLIAVIDRTGYRSLLVKTSLQITLLYCLSVGLVALLALLMSAKLLQPVTEAVKKQRDLFTNASHELKTPLTVISTNLSVIKSEPTSTIEENANWISSIDTQISRMQDLIQNMLELSKIEQTEVPKQEVDFSEITESACLTFEVLCFEKGVTLVEKISPDVKVFGDKAALERLIAILLDNAIKYCGEKGKIGLSLNSDARKATLTVMNTGEVISKEDEGHVFERFYRTDGARKNENNNSFGLGLSIAAETVKAHNGTIACHGIEGKGTVFSVALPVYKKNTHTKSRSRTRS